MAGLCVGRVLRRHSGGSPFLGRQIDGVSASQNTPLSRAANRSARKKPRGGSRSSHSSPAGPNIVRPGIAAAISCACASVGSWIAWGVGMSGGRVLLERHGKYLHITPARLDMADRWFLARGERIVLISRCLPIIRTFISLPAGIARMPFWRFTIYTAIGCLPWVLALTLIGVQVGAKWEEWHKRLEVLDYLVVVAIIAAIVYYVVRRRRGPAHA